MTEMDCSRTMFESRPGYERIGLRVLVWIERVRRPGSQDIELRE